MLWEATRCNDITAHFGPGDSYGENPFVIEYLFNYTLSQNGLFAGEVNAWNMTYTPPQLQQVLIYNDGPLGPTEYVMMRAFLQSGNHGVGFDETSLAELSPLHDEQNRPLIYNPIHPNTQWDECTAGAYCLHSHMSTEASALTADGIYVTPAVFADDDDHSANVRGVLALANHMLAAAVVKEGDPAPNETGMQFGGHWNVASEIVTLSYSPFRAASGNSSSSPIYAFTAMLEPITYFPTSHYEVPSIWALRMPGEGRCDIAQRQMNLIAKAGQTVPIQINGVEVRYTSASFETWVAPIVNDADQVIFRVKNLEAVNPSDANNPARPTVAILRYTWDLSGPPELEVVVHNGGLPTIPPAGGFRSYADIGYPVSNALGQVGFGASFQDYDAQGQPVGGYRNGIFLNSDLIAVNGQTVQTSNGDATIESMRYTGWQGTGSGGSDGRPRCLNNRGEMALAASIRLNQPNAQPIDAILAYKIPCSNRGADYDGDGDGGTDADTEAFFACLAGNCCEGCTTDLNCDGDAGTDADIAAFFKIMAGAPC